LYIANGASGSFTQNGGYVSVSNRAFLGPAGSFIQSAGTFNTGSETIASSGVATLSGGTHHVSSDLSFSNLFVSGAASLNIGGVLRTDPGSTGVATTQQSGGTVNVGEGFNL